MGTCTATFTKETYNLGETIRCDFTWTGGIYCSYDGYVARLVILNSNGVEVEAHISQLTSCSSGCYSTYLPTQAGTTWTGKIYLFQAPNCNPPMCVASDTCTIISPTVTLALASSPISGGTTHAVPPCCTYTSGDYIGVHAVASSGWHFDYWTDNHGNTFYSSEWNFYITSNTTCTAHFSLATTYTLSLNNSPYAGGYIWNDYTGNNCTVTQCNIINIPAGTAITLSAYTNTGWVFSGWGGDIGGCIPTNPDCDVIMNQDRNITAVYSPIPTYTLTRAASGNGDLPACSPPCCTYTSGDIVTLTANAWSGWHFDHWTGTNNNNVNPTNVTMNSNKSVTAYYLVNPQQCWITAAYAGQGSVNVTPSGCRYPNDCDCGTIITIEAIPANGYYFDHWSGDYTGPDNPATFHLNNNMAVTATFLPIIQGACCIGTNCTQTTQANCTGTWNQNISCTPNPCLEPPPTGSAEITACPVLINQTITAYFTWNNAVQPSMDDIAYMYIKRPGGSIAVFWIEDTYGNPTGTKELSIPIDQTGTWTAHIDIANGAGNWITYEDSCILEPGYSLMVTIDPTAGGQVNANPDLETYPKDTSVQLTAQASLGYSFDYWTGGLTGKTNPATIIMNSDKTVVAHFKSLAEVTCYGCNLDEVKSDGFPIGTTCSETNTPGYPFSEYPNCSSSNLTKYLVYAGIGLAITGAVVYLIRRKTTTKIEQPPQSQVKKQRKTRR